MAGYVLDGASKSVVEIDGRQYAYFGGTNYYGLSYHPEVVMAAQEGLIRWGISSAGSRLTTGGTRVHLELEEALRDFLGCDGVSTSCSGYLSDYIVLQALASTCEVCIVDEQCHNSLMNAVRGIGQPLVTYAHVDVDALERSLSTERAAGRTALICSDGVFASSGEICPLDEIVRLAAQFDARVLIDDAHGIGAIGERGRGIVDIFDVGFERLVVNGTLSKAFGCFGGFSAGNAGLAAAISAHSSAYVGSTPLPPAIAAAALVALRIVREGDELRRRLQRNIRLMKDGLRVLGLALPESPAPIAMFVIASEHDNLEIHRRLMAEGFLIPYSYYPGGPKDGYFRMVVTAQHTEAQVTQALAALKQVMLTVGEKS